MARTVVLKCMTGSLAGAGNFDGNLDNMGLSVDINARANYGGQAQHGEPSGHSSLWPTCPQLLATSNAVPGAITSSVAQFLGMA